MNLEETLSKAKYKIPSEAADKAFAMMNLGDKFRLDFREYRESVSYTHLTLPTTPYV